MISHEPLITDCAFSASFLGEVLSRMNSMLSECGARKERFNIQRVDKRMLITSVGDVVFDCTYFKRKTEQGGYSYLLEELIGLDSYERFSEEVEVMLLTEAVKTSYREATKVLNFNLNSMINSTCLLELR